MLTWKTKDGKEIPYKNLADSHLLNIKKFIEKRASEGFLMVSGGADMDGTDPWYEEYTATGKEVLDHFDYEDICKEIKRRQLC